MRTDIGVDTTDHSLDLVIKPDFTWQWKDDDIAQQWVDLGVYTQAHTDQFFADGAAVIEMAKRRLFPFDGSFRDWEPSPAWPVPTVRPGWEDIPGFDLNLTAGTRLENLDP